MKTALITGASRGIGEAAAYQLAKEYDCVAIMSRNTDGKLNTVANQIHATTNCECIPFTGDVSDFAFVEECVRTSGRYTRHHRRLLARLAFSGHDAG